MSEHHNHPVRPKSPQQLRAEALEAVLIERGLVSTDAVDAVVEAFQSEIGPQNGARMVARAWVDPEYRERMLTDASFRTTPTYRHFLESISHEKEPTYRAILQGDTEDENDRCEKNF